jgi:segregation and condensation protein A
MSASDPTTLLTPAFDVESALNGESGAGDYKIKLGVFEGPLDLLLHLIKRHELDIYDIPIAKITAEYLRYIQTLRDLDIDVAGEFLLMAATLIHIKSRMLLPVDPATKAEDGTETEDPRAELVRQLLEHQRYKSAAQTLWMKYEVEQGVFMRPPLDPSENNEIVATVFDLLETFKRIMERRRERIEVEIAREEVTQAQKMAELKTLLAQHSRVNVTKLFEAATNRREMVCLLLAILEMLKGLLITFTQERTFGDIVIQLAEPAAAE